MSLDRTYPQALVLAAVWKASATWISQSEAWVYTGDVDWDVVLKSASGNRVDGGEKGGHFGG